MRRALPGSWEELLHEAGVERFLLDRIGRSRAGASSGRSASSTGPRPSASRTTSTPGSPTSSTRSSTSTRPRRSSRSRSPASGSAASCPRPTRRGSEHGDRGADGPSTKRSRFPVRDVTVAGSLAVPGRARGIVVFAHGSGSGRFSPRNRAVARVLLDGRAGHAADRPAHALPKRPRTSAPRACGSTSGCWPDG